MDMNEARTLAETVAEMVIDKILPRPEQGEYKEVPVATFTEQEAEDLLKTLGDLTDIHHDDAETVLVPVNRDWATTFAHSIRRQERKLAAERLRARLGTMFTPSYVESLMDAVNPPEGELPE